MTSIRCLWCDKVVEGLDELENHQAYCPTREDNREARIAARDSAKNR